MSTEQASGWRYVTFYDDGGLHVEKRPATPMMHVEREYLDGLLSRLAAAESTALRYIEHGRSVDEIELAKLVLAIVRGKT